MTNKLQIVEYTTLNIASIGWVVVSIFEWLPILVTCLVGLSIVFLNVARGINYLKKKKK